MITAIPMTRLIIPPLAHSKWIKYIFTSKKFITLPRKGKTLTSCHDNKVIPPLLKHGLNHFPLYPADECRAKLDLAAA